MSTKTTTGYANEFKDSPRYRKILAIFEAIDALPADEPILGVMAQANKCMREGNGIERDALPDLVRRALADRGRSHRF